MISSREKLERPKLASFGHYCTYLRINLFYFNENALLPPMMLGPLYIQANEAKLHNR